MIFFTNKQSTHQLTTNTTKINSKMIMILSFLLFSIINAQVATLRPREKAPVRYFFSYFLLFFSFILFFSYFILFLAF